MQPSQDGILGTAARKWQENFDPRHFRSKELITHTSNYTDLNNRVNTLATDNAKQLDALTTATTGTEAELVELRRLQDRSSWLKGDQWTQDGAQQLERLKGDVVLNKGLFTAEEVKLLADRQGARASVTELTAAQQQSTKFLGESPGGNFVKGAAFVGLTMVADHYLDKIITGHDHQDGLSDSSMTNALPMIGGLTNSWHTNSLLLPMAFASGGWSGKGLVAKAAYTGAALVGGKLLDSMLPASDHQSYSSWLKPNGVDSVLMAGAFLLPAAENKTRLAG